MTDHFVLDVHPDELRTAAKQLDTLSHHVQAKGTTVTNTPGDIGDQWTGEAATSVKAEMAGLGTHMKAFSGKLTSSKAALDGLADDYDSALTQVAHLNTQWQQAQTDYAAAVSRADGARTSSLAGGRRPGDPPLDKGERDDIDSAHTNAVSQAARDRSGTQGSLETQFAHIREWVGTRTGAASGKLVDALPLPVPPDVVAAYQRTGAFPVRLDRSGLEDGMGLTAAIDAHELALESRAEGQRVAQELKDADGVVSAKLAKEIKDHSGDPDFAYGLASSMTPTQISHVLAMYDVQRTQDPKQSEEQYDATWSTLVEGLGQTLATATRGRGELALPPGYAHDYAAAITAKGYAERDGQAPPNQAQYLGLLLEFGTYDTDFLTGVGTEVYDYEHGHDGPVWSPKSGITKVVGPDGRQRIDVMASLMKGLSHNAEASQQFFSSGSTTTIEVDGHQVTVSERMKYLVQDRTWDTMTDSTNGANLGEALRAATTALRDAGPSGRTSAQLASQLFVVIADKTGDGSDNRWRPDDDGWQMWKGMRASVADIVAGYSTDLLRMGRAGSPSDDLEAGSVDPENDLFLRGMPYGAAMSRSVMAKVIGTLAFDDADMDKVLAGIAVASSLRTGRALEDSLGDHGHPSAPAALLQGLNVPRVATATTESATTLGWILNAGYGARLDKDEVAKKNAEMRAKVFDALTSLPGVGPAGEWAKFGFDQATSALSEKIGASNATTDDDYNTLGPQERTKLQQSVLNQMAANGYFDTSYFDEANGGPDSTRYPPPPPGVLVDEPKPPHIDFDSPAYAKWLRDGFPLDTMLASTVTVPFDQGLTDGHQLAGGG